MSNTEKNDKNKPSSIDTTRYLQGYLKRSTAQHEPDDEKLQRQNRELDACILFMKIIMEVEILIFLEQMREEYFAQEEHSRELQHIDEVTAFFQQLYESSLANQQKLMMLTHEQEMELDAMRDKLSRSLSALKMSTAALIGEITILKNEMHALNEKVLKLHTEYCDLVKSCFDDKAYLNAFGNLTIKMPGLNTTGTMEISELEFSRFGHSILDVVNAKNFDGDLHQAIVIAAEKYIHAQTNELKGQASEKDQAVQSLAAACHQFIKNHDNHEMIQYKKIELVDNKIQLAQKQMTHDILEKQLEKNLKQVESVQAGLNTIDKIRQDKKCDKDIYKMLKKTGEQIRKDIMMSSNISDRTAEISNDEVKEEKSKPTIRL